MIDRLSQVNEPGTKQWRRGASTGQDEVPRRDRDYAEVQGCKMVSGHFGPKSTRHFGPRIFGVFFLLLRTCFGADVVHEVTQV